MPMQKVAMITGSGSRRIGNTVARALAERGYSVVVHYHRSADEAAQTVSELESRGVAALAVDADLRQESDVNRLVQAALARFGRIDVLVNSAAVWTSKPLEQVTAA